MLLKNSRRGCSLRRLLLFALDAKTWEPEKRRGHSRLIVECDGPKGGKGWFKPEGRPLDIAILQMQYLRASWEWETREGNSIMHDIWIFSLPTVSTRENPKTYLATTDRIIDSDGLTKKHFKSMPLRYHTNSDMVIQRIKQWMVDCEKHELCRHSLPCLPTRVIDVRGNGSQSLPFLHISTPGQRARYATLSYCWGGPQKVVTSKSSIFDNIKGFELDTLPRTIQDALEVTRKLDMQYLWVDALCIIQDDLKDTGIEIDRIGKIYKNSSLNISVVGFENVESGFLSIREEPHVTVPIMIEGRESKVAIAENSYAYWSGGPLDTRAWAFQEFLLLPRTLLYGQNGEVWCQCQSKPAEPIVERPSKEFRATAQFPLLKREFHSLRKPLQDVHDSQWWTWKKLVEQFSRREITKPEDRLPALAGIASELATFWDDEYLAGTWKKCLQKCLVWSRAPHSAQYFIPSTTAPTWSWAHVNEEVDIRYFHHSIAEVVSCKLDFDYSTAGFGKVKEEDSRSEGLS